MVSIGFIFPTGVRKREKEKINGSKQISPRNIHVYVFISDERMHFYGFNFISQYCLVELHMYDGFSLYRSLFWLSWYLNSEFCHFIWYPIHFPNWNNVELNISISWMSARFSIHCLTTSNQFIGWSEYFQIGNESKSKTKTIIYLIIVLLSSNSQQPALSIA